MRVKKIEHDTYLIYGRKKVNLKELKKLINGVAILDADQETMEDIKNG